MPTKTSAKGARSRRDYNPLIDEIRQVMRDEKREFVIKCHEDAGFEYPKIGDTDVLTSDLAYEIIRDLVNGKAGLLTRDYRATKAANARAAKHKTPAPA
jgi:hypothetical protein